MSSLTYRYHALDAKGSSVKGDILAESREEAYRRIVALGHTPVRIKSARGERLRNRNVSVSVKDLAHFSHQLAVLLEARIPIVDGLRSIAEQESKEDLREVIERIAREIENGSSVSDAIGPHRRTFGEVYVETIRAAETSGTMIEVLSYLADMLEQQHETNRSIRGALMYPVCVVTALSLAVIFLILVVIPKFSAMYEKRGIDLPALTQALMATSGAIMDYWYIVIGGTGVLFLVMRRIWRTPTGRRKIDGLFHRIPFLNAILRGLAVSRFAQVLSISLRSGLGLIEALDMAGSASGRPILAADVRRMRDQVNEGGRLTDVMSTCTYLPAFCRRMIAAGEETGELSRLSNIVARHYNREVSYMSRNVATVIEPILIAGLAGVVLLIALAIFLPMWNMGSLIG